MKKLHVKKGDEVVVITGDTRIKGKRGVVTSVDKEKERVTVEGVNMGVRHVKPQPNGEEGGRIEFARSIHVSNVKLVSSKSDKKSSKKSDKG